MSTGDPRRVEPTGNPRVDALIDAMVCPTCRTIWNAEKAGCSDLWHYDNKHCPARYERPGGAQPGDRIVACHLQSGHPGEHEEEGTEVTWWGEPAGLGRRARVHGGARCRGTKEPARHGRSGSFAFGRRRYHRMNSRITVARSGSATRPRSSHSSSSIRTDRCWVFGASGMAGSSRVYVRDGSYINLRCTYRLRYRVRTPYRDLAADSSRRGPSLE